MTCGSRAELALIRRALAELELTRRSGVALESRRNALLAELANSEAQEGPGGAGRS